MGGECNPKAIAIDTAEALYTEARDRPVKTGFDVLGFGTYSMGEFIDEKTGASDDMADRGIRVKDDLIEAGIPEGISHVVGFGGATPIVGIAVEQSTRTVTTAIQGAKAVGAFASSRDWGRTFTPWNW